jgi:hypothetical protein
MKIWPYNKTFFGHLRLRHYDHNFYFPNSIGRWHIRVRWRGIAVVTVP